MVKNNCKVIGEIKLRTPFDSAPVANFKEQLGLCKSSKVDIVSVHTNERWGGSLESLGWCCTHIEKPILAKGFHPTIMDVETCLSMGATYVLTVGWFPKEYRDKVFYEVHDLSALSESDLTDVVVINSRDPRVGGHKDHDITNNFKKPKGVAICQASNIKSVDDIYGFSDYALVGTHLKEFLETC